MVPELLVPQKYYKKYIIKINKKLCLADLVKEIKAIY